MEIERKSGILLHITSLPSPFGIGDFGEDAYRFADFLRDAGQHLWQMLPLNPTDLAFGNSPYSSESALAMNPLLIDPTALVRDGLLPAVDLDERPVVEDERVDFEAVARWKKNILARAFHALLEGRGDREGFHRFCEENARWLDDYVLFRVLRAQMRGRSWQSWPGPLRSRNATALAEAAGTYREHLDEERFKQYLCFEQWRALRAYCHERDIALIGDIPLYVNYESADVWAHPELFKLDEAGRPLVVSGVPPDFFSSTGQLWNNPIYDWEKLEEEDYWWWVERIASNMRLFDWLRIDHFRGFAGFWEVPAGSETAAGGSWVRGPGNAFFRAVSRRLDSLPFIAEDLGVITEDVIALREELGLPGMRVFQFGFGRDGSRLHRPRSYPEQAVAYTGTHDNDTLLGWLYDTHLRVPVRLRRRLGVRAYTGCPFVKAKNLRWSVISSLMGSSARWVIIPMQDILGLGAEARMNKPGTGQGNWTWRMAPGSLGRDAAERLSSLTARYRTV